MKDLKIRSKKTKAAIKFTVPETWEELSTGSFEALKGFMLQGPLNPRQLLSGVTGIELGFWQGVSLDEAAPVLQIVQRFWDDSEKNPNFLKLPPPKEIELKGKKIKIKQKPGQYGLAQVEAMNQKFKAWADQDLLKEGKLAELLPYASEVIAIFVQPDFDEDIFDEEASKDLIPAIKELPATEGIPLARFFLSMFLRLLQIGLKHTTQTKRRIPLLRRLGLIS
jgi:hypothetical protein